MQERDGRSVPEAALEVLRERAVAMHAAGNAQLAIAAALGLHKNTVYRWLKGWRVPGERWFPGRIGDDHSALTNSGPADSLPA